MADFIHRQEIPFVRILVPFASGILLFYGCRNAWLMNYLTYLEVSCFLYLLYQNSNPKKIQSVSLNGIKGLKLHIFFFLTGCLCVTLYNQTINTDYYAFKKSNFLKITISEEPQIRQNIILFTAKVTKSIKLTSCLSIEKHIRVISQGVSGKIKVSVTKNKTIPMSLSYGDELIIPANFRETPSPLNPSEFDFKSWLASQNIYHQIFLKPDQVIILNTNSGNMLMSFALNLRKKQVDTYRRLIKNDDAFAVATTLILGYKADLSGEILDIYSKTGTIHALSVSGMHVGMVYLILNYLFGFLNRNQTGKITKTLLILTAIWFYSLLTGFSPAVSRAAIMISVDIIARLFTRNTNSYNIIAFAAFCLLLNNPFLICDAGFQLSFMAVLGLTYLQPKIQLWLPVAQPWLAKLWGVMAMSLAAQLATYPLSVYHFHQFPVYFLLINLFITIPSALIMYIGIIILFLQADWLGPLFEWLINFTNNGLAQIAKLPGSGITAIWLSKTELTLLCLSLLLCIIACNDRKKWALIWSAALFLIFQASITADKLRAFQQRETIRFTLRKNYAVAMITGHRAILFTDLKPDSKTFMYSVKPALDQLRVTQVKFQEVNVTRF